MNAAVEPLPFVPAIWIALSASKSDGYRGSSQLDRGKDVATRAFSMVAYFVPDLVAPLDHLGNGLIIHLPSRLTNRINNGKIRLQRVERGDGILNRH